MRNQAVDALHLQTISAKLTGGDITRNQAREALIDLIMLRMRCSRVSLWRFDGEYENLAMLCFAAKEAGGALDVEEKRLEMSEYRDYFDDLINQGTYVSNDTLNDPHLQGMRRNYVERYGVLAMLDVAYMLNGRVYGMVCCEQIGNVRVWRADELSELRAIVSRLTMLRASANDPTLWGSPSLPMTPLSAGQEASQQADTQRFDQRRQ